MTRLTIITTLIATATTASAHPGHAASTGSETWMIAGFVIAALAALPVVRKALGK